MNRLKGKNKIVIKKEIKKEENIKDLWKKIMEKKKGSGLKKFLPK